MTILFGILMFLIFGKLALFAFKMAWGVARIVLTIVFLPIILIVMVINGLLTIALPILVVIGIIVLVKTIF